MLVRTVSRSLAIVWLVVLAASSLAAQGIDGAVASADRVAMPPPAVLGPIAVTQASRPLLDARADLAAVGYVEEEFFLKGRANVYEWAGDGAVKVVAGPGDYVTRILVRRPADAGDFSGNIEVKVLNATYGFDYGTFTDFERMTREGDVWVGITSKPVNANALKRFDPHRYALLDWSNPADPSTVCDYPTFYPVYMTGDSALMRLVVRLGILPRTSVAETEDGLLWDMLAQLGVLLKSDARQQILPGFGEPKIFMTGISQSSIVIWTWVSAFHERLRMPDGAPIYDGYLAIVGPALARISQCSEDVPLDDPRHRLRISDVPFIALYSEGEMWLAKHTRQQNNITIQGGIVTYEVAGAAHSRLEIPGSSRKTVGRASAEAVERIASRAADTSWLEAVLLWGDEPTDFYWAPLMRAAYANLKAWARDGVLPPQAPLIALDDNMTVRRDKFGNAIGGVRMPAIDVPVASYRGNIRDGGLGAIIGTREPFPLAKLETLYGNRSGYIEKFSEATDRLLEQRWLLPEDAVAMKRAAQTAWPRP